MKKSSHRTVSGAAVRNVAVFFGGNSSESEISVITGMYAVNLLRGTRYRVFPVYLPPSGGFLLGEWKGVEEFAGAVKGTPVTLSGSSLVRAGRKKPCIRIDVALNCCHGGMGEDGTLAALLRWNRIVSASPSVAESALFMDKTLTKIAARGLGIAAAPSIAVSERDYATAPEEVLSRIQAFGFPLVVKPARLGSSIGLTVVRERGGLADALALAFELDSAALIERYFAKKRDVNCAACRLDGQIRVSPCEEVFSGGELLSYAEKYEQGKGSCMPAELPEAVSSRIADDTRRLYEAFGMRGVVRADFLVVGEEVFFNELNTVPGSLAGYLFGDTLAQIRRFFVALLDEALLDAPREKKTLTTGILSSGIFTGAKGCKRRGNFV